MDYKIPEPLSFDPVCVDCGLILEEEKIFCDECSGEENECWPLGRWGLRDGEERGADSVFGGEHVLFGGKSDCVAYGGPKMNLTEVKRFVLERMEGK